ncbi:hypothetical protein [Aromatoleum tolulyticum]|nr:hypothetical protein [Aromatoleum tolulyticum]
MTYRNILLTAALLAIFANPAAAKDAVQSSVSDWTGTPIIQNNGNPDAQGTFAVGTIQLTYTVVGYTFTAGDFGSFKLNWGVQANYSGGQSTSYSPDLTLKIEQIGGSHLELTPSPAEFNPLSNTAQDTSVIDIAIGSNVPNDPALNCDGCTLVGNLKLVTDPSGAKLDTVTNVQVKLVLAHPDSCLKAYNFITNQDTGSEITTTTLNVATNGAKKGTVTSSAPGQFSDDVLVANTCANEQDFDLKIALDPNFETNPSNNAGNAVFTYSKNGAVDQQNFDLSSFGLGTPQGQQVCLRNVTIPADSSFLATVHSQVKKGTVASALPASKTFQFAAALHQTSNSACAGELRTDVAPGNPVGAALGFTY